MRSPRGPLGNLYKFCTPQKGGEEGEEEEKGGVHVLDGTRPERHSTVFCLEEKKKKKKRKGKEGGGEHRHRPGFERIVKEAISVFWKGGGKGRGKRRSLRRRRSTPMIGAPYGLVLFPRGKEKKRGEGGKDDSDRRGPGPLLLSFRPACWEERGGGGRERGKKEKEIGFTYPQRVAALNRHSYFRRKKREGGIGGGGGEVIWTAGGCEFIISLNNNHLVGLPRR